MLSPHMAFNAQPGEQYVIRRKVLKIFGAAFHVYAPDGSLVAFCKQKAFKLKEDIRLFADEECTQPLLVIAARNILDFSTTYDVTLPTGEVVGSLRRKGMSSTFIRDTWLVFNAANAQIATLQEDSGWLGFARRYIDLVSLLVPQKFQLTAADGRVIASFRTHFNLFVYRLSITIHADDPQLDDLVILAAGCLVAAIEGRQSGG